MEKVRKVIFSEEFEKFYTGLAPVKKSTKQYKGELKTAEKILRKYMEE